MKKVLSVLLAAAMTAGMMTGCGGSGETAATAAATEAAAAESTTGTSQTAAPENAKSIVYGMTGTWNSLMPFDAATTNSWMIQDVLYEPLGKYGDGEVAWRAANSIDVEDEGKTWVVHLNDKVKWHDGEPSDADDWVWTMETVTDPEFGIYKGLSRFNQIAGTDETGKRIDGEEFGVQKVDDYTFTIKWKAPSAIPAWMGGDCAYFRAVPKHLLEDIPVSELGSNEFWQHPVGNGCCIFVEEPVPGQELKLKANKDYYLGAPEFDDLTYLIVDASNAANAYLNGEMDVYNGDLEKDIREQLIGQNGLHMEKDTTVRRITLMEINNSKFSTPVRKALDTLIDKQVMVDAIADGDGEPKGDPTLTYLDCYLPYEHTVDVEGAKKMLEDAGFDFNQTIKMVCAPTRENIAMIIQQNWAAAGVKSEIVVGEQTSILAMQRDGESDCYIGGWYEKTYPCAQASYFSPETGTEIHTKDYKYINLANEIGFCEDEAKLTELYHEWQNVLREECPIIFLYSSPSYHLLSEKINGGVLSGIMDMPWLWDIND
ncbi:MAG: ABC transporter substrate-binding protein [Brotaphodocola sp.]